MPDVLITDEAKVRWITLNRPETRNALTTALNQAVITAIQGAEAAGARVVVLSGAGGAFSSGLDLRVAAEEGMDPSTIEGRMRSYFHGLIRAVRSCPLPTVAVVDGAAAGFGCDLALAADLRLCSDRARFGEVFVKRGLMPDGGGTWTLPRLVGLGRAMEMMLTGELVDAAEAHRIGLVNRVFPAAELEPAAWAFARGARPRPSAGPPGGEGRGPGCAGVHPGRGPGGRGAGPAEASPVLRLPGRPHRLPGKAPPGVPGRVRRTSPASGRRPRPRWIPRRRSPPPARAR